MREIENRSFGRRVKIGASFRECLHEWEDNRE